jgi:translation initiation factor IF-2
MGHVDHGKTTLLDYIRKSNIAAKEAGGITQSIGAYEIRHQISDVGGQREEKITFIDTPGHEAFIKMRQRGAQIADIGILVVAADDSVQNQTKEAFKILQESEIPVIVVINKTDRPGIDINRVKSDLAAAGILIEGYGGTISWQAVSGKTGEGVDELLDFIVLTSDLENLSYDPEAVGEGFILESRMDSSRGVVATAIIKNGKLKTGDGIFSPSASGKIKSLENFLGKKINEAIPSMPVLILGFQELPEVGEIFTTNQKSGIPVFAERLRQAGRNLEKSDIPVINLILKADTSGSLEAFSQIIKNLPANGSKIIIINESVGDVTDGDIKSAIASKAIVLGFKTRVNKQAENLARANSITIIKSEIVYELVKAVEDYLKNLVVKKNTGELEILAVFGKKGQQQIIGGKVLAGEIKNNSRLAIERKGITIGDGKVVNLQQKKMDSKAVLVDNECGLLFDSEAEVKIGDRLISKF